MTKEAYENYGDKMVYCFCCGRTLNKYGVHPDRIRKDGTVKRCKTCDWIYRRGGIPSVDGFTEEQVKYALEFILMERSIYLNDLSAEMNLSMDDIIAIVNSLNVGNKRYVIKSNCANCGKDVEEVVSVYTRNKDLFCSSECYHQFRAKTLKRGKDSSFYNKILTNCTNCNKEIEVIPYNYNKTNRFGNNHNFCSQECYWEYRAKYYVGEKSSRIHSTMSPEAKEKMRRSSAERLRNVAHINSKIQLKVNNILDNNNINYEREYPMMYYSIDNFLVDHNLIVEVMGDYWHTSPLRYNEFAYKINKIQQKGLVKDKQKYTYVKNHYGIEILYLWETDINTDTELCEKLILKYIDNNGVLDNYHSFNWTVDNGVLKLKDSIVTPYQNMKTSEYADLLVDKKTG